ncbi:MAG: hypothetical protein H3C64_11875 [Candidatus Kuenenia stuttgartiensis]|nr:hypothetical protein [Candidatus Kuenenia stuttgartiensis]
MIISAVLIFAGCNAAMTDKDKKESAYLDTVGITQKSMLTTEYQKIERSQIEDTSDNLTDKQGRKQGLWIEDNGSKEVYYLNGKKNGVYKSYFKKTGKLEVLGWYQQDKSIGDWYYFDETSRLFMVEKPSGENKEIKIRNDEGTSILLPFKSYVQLYNKNGIIAKEGLALYEEDIQLEFYMYGKWKYYDETGKLIKEENYQHGKIVD